jgi:hypothetical protein
MEQIMMLNKNMPIAKGYLYSIVHNFLKEEYYIFPTSGFSEIIQHIENNNLDKISQRTKDRFIDIGLLLEVNKDIVQNFEVQIPHYDTPHDLTNIVVDFNGKIDYLTFFNYINPSHILFLVSESNYSPKIIDLVNQLPQHEITITFESSTEFMKDFDLSNLFLSNLFEIHFYKSEEDKIVQPIELSTVFYFYTDFFPSVNDTDIDKNSFYCNLSLYRESINVNAFFYKKMFLSKDGIISNIIEENQGNDHIESVNSYGDLKKIIDKKSFQKYWYIKKDMCDVCKDCEYRYMCVDNRIPINRNKNEWFFESECNYNPYIGKWKREDGFYTLVESGVTSNIKTFYIDYDKLNEIQRKRSNN